MLIALGTFSLEPLFAGLSAMAQDGTTKHELNEVKGPGTYLHKDGWGIASLHRKQWAVKKSLLPIFADDRKKEFYSLKTKVALIHARKRSKGEIAEKDTHPFFARLPQEGEIVFAHNGTISGTIPPCRNPRKIKGSTDSEHFFHALLDNFLSEHPEIIRETLRRCTGWDGSNIILSTITKTFVSVNFKAYPHYYEMALGKKKGFVCVSSERLPLLKGVVWKLLKEGDLLEINHQTLEITWHR